MNEGISYKCTGKKFCSLYHEYLLLLIWVNVICESIKICQQPGNKENHNTTTKQT